MLNLIIKQNFFAEDDKIIIQISRFQLQKDQKTLIKALTLLPNQYKLLLVGDGELRPDCEKVGSGTKFNKIV